VQFPKQENVEYASASDLEWEWPAATRDGACTAGKRAPSGCAESKWHSCILRGAV